MSSNLPTHADDLIASALQLSVSDRVALAAAMLESVDDIPSEQLPDSGEIWEEEIGRRVDEIDSGAVDTIPSSEMWKRLGGKPENGN